MSAKSIMLQGVKTFFSLKPTRDYSISQKRAIAGVISVSLLQALDYTTTTIGMNMGAYEANGLMAAFIQEQGNLAFLFLKVAGATFLSWVTWKRRFAPWTITVLYSAVVISNLTVIARLA